MANNYFIYLHKNPINGEIIYIGIGANKYRPFNFNERNPIWKRYVSKHGEPQVEIIHENLSKKEACKLEIKYINQYGRRLDNSGTLCNISIGGEGGNKGIIWTDEQNKSRAESRRGYKHSEETKNKMRNKKLGKPLSKEHRKKISESRLGVKQPNISKALTGKKQSIEEIKKRYKPVLQIDKQGNIIQEYESVTSACKAIKRDMAGLSNTLLGKQKTCGGYFWKYKN
jgi:hypothetical protein